MASTKSQNIAEHLLKLRVLGLGWLVAGFDLRVLGFSLISDLSLVTAIAINGVGHLLSPAIGKINIVRPGGLISIPGFLLSVIVLGVVILDRPVEVIRGGSIARLSRLIRAGLVGSGKGNSGEGSEGKEGLKWNGKYYALSLYIITVIC